MRKARLLTAGAAVAVAAVAAGVTPVAADHSHRVTGAVMTGAREAPGPGDPDGFGVAGVVVDAGSGRICYALAVKNIAPATMAHIHRGASGVAGPVVVDFNAPSGGFSAACTTVGAALAGEIAHSPRDFYVNVHNAEFPAGAVRGQLR